MSDQTQPTVEQILLAPKAFADKTNTDPALLLDQAAERENGPAEETEPEDGEKSTENPDGDGK